MHYSLSILGFALAVSCSLVQAENENNAKTLQEGPFFKDCAGKSGWEVDHIHVSNCYEGDPCYFSSGVSLIVEYGPIPPFSMRTNTTQTSIDIMYHSYLVLEDKYLNNRDFVEGEIASEYFAIVLPEEAPPGMYGVTWKLTNMLDRSVVVCREGTLYVRDHKPEES